MADVPLLVVSENTASERRITPSWTISQLKSKLEHITGIPPSCQTLVLGGQPLVVAGGGDEDTTTLSSLGQMVPYSELRVGDTRPAAARLDLADTGNVQKFVLDDDAYAAKTDSVLAWKKAQKLGRFDPDAPAHAAARIAAFAADAQARGIQVGKRCRVGHDDARRGVVRYVGDVPEIVAHEGQTAAGVWVGVELDEPVGGKNDGSIGGTRYWGKEPQEGQAVVKRGVFVRPERVEAGDYPALDDLEDMEEI